MNVTQLQKFLKELRGACDTADDLNSLREHIYILTDRHLDYDDFNEDLSDFDSIRSNDTTLDNPRFGRGFKDEMDDIFEDHASPRRDPETLRNDSSGNIIDISDNTDNNVDLSNDNNNDMFSDYSEPEVYTKLSTTINSQELARDRLKSEPTKKDMSALELIRKTYTNSSQVFQRGNSSHLPHIRNTTLDRNTSVDRINRTNYHYTEPNDHMNVDTDRGQENLDSNISWPDSASTESSRQSSASHFSSNESSQMSTNSKDSPSDKPAPLVPHLPLALHSDNHQNFSKSPDKSPIYTRSSSSPLPARRSTPVSGPRDVQSAGPVGPGGGEMCPVVGCNCVFTEHDSLSFKTTHVNNHFNN